MKPAFTVWADGSELFPIGRADTDLQTELRNHAVFKVIRVGADGLRERLVPVSPRY